MTFVLLYVMAGFGYALSKLFTMRDEDMFQTMRLPGMPAGAFAFAMAIGLLLIGALWPLFLLGDGLDWLHKRHHRKHHRKGDDDMDA